MGLQPLYSNGNKPLAVFLNNGKGRFFSHAPSVRFWKTQVLQISDWARKHDGMRVKSLAVADIDGARSPASRVGSHNHG